MKLAYIFVTILTDMFNHWFPQGAISSSVTKGVIILLKKSDRHVWEDLDDYTVKDFGPGLSKPFAACY